jgi:hypothetical protein
MFETRKYLLSISKDAKTVKGQKLGFLTGILYLAPADVSGYQVCPKATAGCKAACLFTAGRGVYAKVRNGRINRTRWFFEGRDSFMATIVRDVERLVRKAKREKLIPAVRLNGTSDIAWEKIKVVRHGITYRNLMTAFPEVQHYDYTKIAGRHAAVALPNYHLTFSLAEDNDAAARIAIDNGYNVAVVVNTKRSEVKPASWGGYPAINGDDSDVRFLDAKGGHVVLLTAKGKARYDNSGFVRKVKGGFSIPLALAA